MIRSSEEVVALERRLARRTQLTGDQAIFEEALRAFTALWRHAKKVNPHFTAGWEEDLATDLELVRVLRGIPEHP